MNLKRKEEDIDDLEEEPIEDGDDLGGEDDYLGDTFGDDFYGEESTSPMQKHADLLKGLTNFSPYLKESLNNWLGITWDEESKSFKPNPSIKPIMNIYGAMWCIGLIKTYVRDNNIITDIREQDYKNILSDHIENIWLNLGTRKEFGIKNNGDLLRVANELEHAAALILMGAGDGRYNKFLGTTIHRTESVGNTPGAIQPYMLGNQAPKKSGFLDKIKRAIIGR